MIRFLSPVAYRRQPWKNGGGTTTEMVVHPEGAGWDDFQWRVGIADIGRSGPFSVFPGIDRSIMLLHCPPGSGMTLTIDGVARELPLHEFVDFPGEARADGILRREPVRDFNVMSRRAAFAHRRDWCSLAPGQWLRLGEGESRFVYVVAGELHLMTAVRDRKVTADESLLAEGSDSLNLRAGNAGAQLVWATFTAVPPAETAA